LKNDRKRFSAKMTHNCDPKAALDRWLSTSSRLLVDTKRPSRSVSEIRRPEVCPIMRDYMRSLNIFILTCAHYFNLGLAQALIN
jgi:hypothetical protein